MSRSVVAYGVVFVVVVGLLLASSLFWGGPALDIVLSPVGASPGHP